MKKRKVIFLALLVCAFGASARTVTPEEAAFAARKWSLSGTAMGLRLSSTVAGTTEYAVTNGYSFYEVKMSDGCTVFMTSDTEFDPIVGFSDNGDLDLTEGSPIRELLNKDIVARARLKELADQLKLKTSAASAKASASVDVPAQKQWAALLRSRKQQVFLMSKGYATGAGAGGSADPVSSIDDVRVAPLLDSVWSQTYDYAGNPLYNYYVPEEIACGCTATAAAQIMRHFEYPVDEMPQQTYMCSVNGKVQECTTIAGTYPWAKMLANPNFGAADDEREAVGRICYDIAAALGTSWSHLGGGSAYATDLALVFRGPSFGYRNAYVYSDYNFDTSKTTYGGGLHVLAAREKTIYANLDAGRPVELGIHGFQKGHIGDMDYWAGHAVVGDGYGFKTIDGEKVAFVHINMGWAGTDDLWYNIPEVNSANSGAHIGDSGYDFLFMAAVLFNVSPDDTGDILSGRITDDDGNAVAGAVVVAALDGVDVAETTTDGHGIYAFSLEGGKTYDITARSTSSTGGILMDSREVVLGKTTGDATGNLESLSKIGNRWGNDMVLAEPTVRIVVGTVTNLFTTLNKALKAATNDENKVEILLPTLLKEPVTVMSNCTIVATNEDASASAVSCLGGAKITVADDAKVVVSNLVFDVEEGAKTFVVATNGELRVGVGSFIEAVETVEAKNLVVVSESFHPFYVDCRDAPIQGDSFAMSAIPLDRAASCENKMMHSSNTRLGGEAFKDGEDVKFRWSNVAPVPIERTVAQLDVGSGRVNYRVMSDLFEDYGKKGDVDAEIIVRKSSPYDQYLDKDCHVVIRGEWDAGEETPVLELSGKSGFRLDEGASLKIENIVLHGYVDSDSADDHGFIYVNGGALTLADGATLDGIVGFVDGQSGVIDLMKGSVTTLPGSLIVNCGAEGGYGGAIYVDGAADASDCVLNLFGGTIADCRASEFGGGVYVYASEYYKAQVNVKGLTMIVDNESYAGSSVPCPDNLCLDNVRACPYFALAGELELGSMVGVGYATAVSGLPTGNAEDDAFMVNAVGALGEVSLGAIFNDTDDTLEAATNAVGMLVWAKRIEDGQCGPGETVVALQIDADGHTNYYASVERAFKYMGTNSPYVVEMLAADALEDSVAVPDGCDVTLRAADGVLSASCPLTRGGDFCITVPAGAALCLTNVYISGEGDYEAYLSWLADGDGMRSNPFFDVAGGRLELRSDARICNVLGFGNRASGAIVVYRGGTFAMVDGSLVDQCVNAFVSEENEVSYGVGAGLLVDGANDDDTPSVAFLRGGTIRKCLALRGSAVCVCNGAEVRVSGAMRVEIDEPEHYNDFVVENLSNLYLDEETTGIYNMADGVNGPERDANYIGRVTWDWAGDVVALTNSAARFAHSISGDLGAAVTNQVDSGDVLLVWSGAVSGGQLYTNVVGGTVCVYAPVVGTGGSALSPPVSQPLPELSSSADSEDVAAALAGSGLADSSVASNVRTLAEYNKFRNWARDVVGDVDAVVDSKKAWRSSEFGLTTLLANSNAPTVFMTEVETSGTALEIRVVVKDGDDPVVFAAEAVAKMFEATNDIGDWTKKVDLKVGENPTQNADNSVTFTVEPVDTTSTVFIRLKY